MDNLDKFKRAGKIAKQAKQYAQNLIKEGAKAIDIAEAVEDKIKELGGKPAFPVDVSVNDMAAHYNPRVDDTLVLKKNDLVKIDIGAHINGCVVDTAFSASITKNPENERLISAVEDALKTAISMAVPGVEVRNIGKAIETKIREHGFEPIRNLFGHAVGLWKVHGKPNIPNFYNRDRTKLTAGQIIAIEPFATNGSGHVKSGSGSEVYSLINEANTRQFRDVLNWIRTEYKTLPFAKRHIVKQFGKVKATLAIKQFLEKGLIKEYATLPEGTGGKVAQAEHTIIVKDKPIILT